MHSIVSIYKYSVIIELSSFIDEIQSHLKLPSPVWKSQPHFDSLQKNKLNFLKETINLDELSIG